MLQPSKRECPFSGKLCDLAVDTFPAHYVVASSVGGASVLGFQLGNTIRLADIGEGDSCPRQGLEGTVKVGDRVPVVTDMAGVATRIGPTATTPCVQLNPWR